MIIVMIIIIIVYRMTTLVSLSEMRFFILLYCRHPDVLNLNKFSSCENLSSLLFLNI